MHGCCLECCVLEPQLPFPRGAARDDGSTAPRKQMQQHRATGVEDDVCDFQSLLWRSQPECPHWGCCLLLAVKPKYLGNIS